MAAARTGADRDAGIADVYYGATHCGRLESRVAGGTAFIYEPAYIDAGGPAIAHTLPLQAASYTTAQGLPAFFDNLLAEGWLRDLQARALGVSADDGVSLLWAFGADLAGAVSVIARGPPVGLNQTRPTGVAAEVLRARASLAGVQPKLPVVADTRGFRVAGPGEASTHIAKLPWDTFPGIVDLEWLTALAHAALLPREPVARMTRAEVVGLDGPALVVERFDRAPDGTRRHFEEFNQLLGQPTPAKYTGGYEALGRFVRATPGCTGDDALRLYARILASVLLGNTDAHLKNFAMYHTAAGLRLTPVYDVVAAALDPRFPTLALAMGGAANLDLGRLQPKHIVDLGRAFQISDTRIHDTVAGLGARLPAASDALQAAAIGRPAMCDQLIGLMTKRWRGTFAGVSRVLAKRRRPGG